MSESAHDASRIVTYLVLDEKLVKLNVDVISTAPIRVMRNPNLDTLNGGSTGFGDSLG